MKLAIFYHIYQTGLGAFIYQQQLHRLYTSGLIREATYIHFGVNGDSELFNVPEKAIVRVNEEWGDEAETLIELRNFCRGNPDFRVLYIHMKGVTKECINGESWRLMMEYFVIDRWRKCVLELETYDAVGSNLKVLGPTTWSNGVKTWDKAGTKHFVGNFWWARAQYINKLKDDLLKSDYRLDREFWIGSGGGEMKSCYQAEDHEPYSHFYREVDYVS